MKIMIVEDEMIISEDICMMLEDRGYEVSEQAVDYDDALDSFQKNPPDLVLLDINLIGSKDGIELAEKINEIGPVPFIYTSSLGDNLTIARAKETKPAAYLVKPFKEEQLFAAIEVAMANFSKKGEDLEPTEDEKLPVFNNAIFIKENHRFTKVNLADIQYIQKSDNYLDLFTEEKRYIIRGAMGSFLDQLNCDRIFRTHRSFAINVDHISNITPTKVTIGDREIPLSKSYAESLLSLLNIF